MGTWSRRDREPDKKDERAFKAFLQDKYERKRWYRDPSEVRREKEAGSTETSTSDGSTTSNKPVTLLVQPPSKVWWKVTQTVTFIRVWIGKILKKKT